MADGLRDSFTGLWVAWWVCWLVGWWPSITPSNHNVCFKTKSTHIDADGSSYSDRVLLNGMGALSMGEWRSPHRELIMAVSARRRSFSPSTSFRQCLTKRWFVLSFGPTHTYPRTGFRQLNGTQSTKGTREQLNDEERRVATGAFRRDDTLCCMWHQYLTNVRPYNSV